MSLPNALPASPLSAERTDAIVRVTRDLDASGLWWLSGYAAGLATAADPARLASARADPAAAARPDPATATPLTIVYGSQTGNARRVAERLAEDAGRAGVPVRLLRADAYPLRALKDERLLYIVISTQGDGDPPDDALAFCEFIAGRRAPKLEELRYAVLGLGDSSYPEFCAVARKLDARLAELGATRLLDRVDADLDIDAVANPWRERAVEAASQSLKPLATVTPLRPPAPATTTHGREQPWPAELLANQRITIGGGRDIRHFELSLEGSGLHYEPGDALGVWPRNPQPLVDAVLSTLKLDGGTAVKHGGEELPLRDWLVEKRELTRLARPFLAAHAERADSDELRALLAEGNATLPAWLEKRQVIDLLLEAPATWSAGDLVAALRPLAPRLYSIASSSKEVGEEAHLAVAHVEYRRGGQTRWGVASHFLASSDEDARLPVYIEANERFRLPADPARDVIMIGPGTGVAPFRGFVQERQAVGAAGRNWLFFGNRNFGSDFLYQLEWQRALQSGALARIDLAFSRDQADRVYVQQRLRERGRDLYDWLQGGAHLYVCGANAMGRDVHAALLDVVATHGGLDADAAADHLRQLQSEGRYSRDLY